MREAWKGPPAIRVLLPFPDDAGRPRDAPAEVPGRVAAYRALGRVLAVLAGLCGAVPGLSSPAAGGPSPEVCRPYATRFTEAMIREMWMGAYEYCRVEGVDDAPPALPPDLDHAMPVLEPLWMPGDVPATGTGPSGFPPDSVGWKSWCRRNWPGSFDGQTVIFEADGRGRRARCPG